MESSFARVLKSLMSSFHRSFLSSTLFSCSRKRNLGDVYDESDTNFIIKPFYHKMLVTEGHTFVVCRSR